MGCRCAGVVGGRMPVLWQALHMGNDKCLTNPRHSFTLCTYMVDPDGNARSPGCIAGNSPGLENWYGEGTVTGCSVVARSRSR
jgi:hypothetical protein